MKKSEIEAIISEEIAKYKNRERYYNENEQFLESKRMHERIVSLNSILTKIQRNKK